MRTIEDVEKAITMIQKVRHMAKEQQKNYAQLQLALIREKYALLDNFWIDELTRQQKLDECKQFIQLYKDCGWANQPTSPNEKLRHWYDVELNAYTRVREEIKRKKSVKQ